MTVEKKYWFPAKRYGWGWGIPNVWQGWLVLFVFLLLVVAGAVVVLPMQGQLIFNLYLVIICAALIAVCLLKGEPPRWRWGGR